MKILGVYDGHTATAALLENGKIMSVISEERITREKDWHGFPAKAIDKVLEINNTNISEIDLVVICARMGSATKYEDFVGGGLNPYVSGFNIFKNMLPHSLVKRNWWVEPAVNLASNFRKGRNEVYDFFERKGFDRSKIIFLDHHMCHAYTTFTNPWGQKDDMLILTLDAAGDGYCGTVSVVKNGKFVNIDRMNFYNSLGFLYSRLTQYLGMRPLSHEYKVMGLAAYTKESDSKKKYEIFNKKFMRIDPEFPLRFENLSGAVNKEYLDKFDKEFKGVRFDHLAGGAQMLVEKLIVQWIKNAVKKTGIKNVFCSGGVFMNVKANMKVMQSGVADRFFVFPSCADESNAIGVCNYGYRLLCHKKGIEFKPAKLEDFYFGNGFTEKDILSAIERNKDKIIIKKVENPSKFTAGLLAKGEVVARCSGKMEFGARALGNRSILGHPNNTGVVREINEAIKQRDFWMPFACSVLDKYENEYIVNPKKVLNNWMIICFDTTEKAQKELINGMHQYDLTIRPQVLKREHNPEYYKIIEEFKKLTGIGGILNTSFNLHGEPIVSMPEDAISTLLRSGLKNLMIEDYYIKKRK